jgi:hypothetical protein
MTFDEGRRILETWETFGVSFPESDERNASGFDGNLGAEQQLSLNALT